MASNSHCRRENGVQKVLVREAQGQVDTAGDRQPRCSSVRDGLQEDVISMSGAWPAMEGRSQ